jgi:hypothetical protein
MNMVLSLIERNIFRQPAFAALPVSLPRIIVVSPKDENGKMMGRKALIP